MSLIEQYATEQLGIDVSNIRYVKDNDGNFRAYVGNEEITREKIIYAGYILHM